MKRLFTFFAWLMMAATSHAQLNYHQGDINGDCTTDINDVVTLVNMILNGGNPLTCPDNNHPHAVDLDLPSGTLWSCCNVDAPSPEGYGGYYAWGETSMKLVNDWSTYIHCDGTEGSCKDIGSNIGHTKYDVAYQKWGGFWRMPSSKQFCELLNNCTSEWTVVNGVFGRIFTGKNGSSIFFPSAGFIEGSTLSLSERFGIYWSETSDADNNSRANYLLFSTSSPALNQNPRYAAIPVRPVNVVTLELSMSSVSMTKGNTETLEVLSGSGNYTVVSSDGSVAAAAVNGNMFTIFALDKGSATITITDINTGISCEVAVSVTEQPSSYLTCPDEHHPHLIDLGLPSGTLWACCNVDIEHPEKQSPTNYGGYYAWGETEEKSVYDWSTYIHCDGSSSTCHDLGNIAGTEYDVAYVKWGGEWKMPTKEQRDELLKNCTYEWTTMNRVNGGKFTGSNGGSIFLPAAGYRWESDLHNAGSYGRFWSSTQTPEYSYYAYDLCCDSGGTGTSYYGSRYYGRSVRPVVSKK